MKTVVVQIGNSDDKLKQSEWSQFFEDMARAMDSGNQVHFSGTSRGDAPWQNACFVSEFPEESLPGLINWVSAIGKMWHQDSVAITIGDTKFV